MAAGPMRASAQGVQQGAVRRALPSCLRDPSSTEAPCPRSSSRPAATTMATATATTRTAARCPTSSYEGPSTPRLRPKEPRARTRVQCSSNSSSNHSIMQSAVALSSHEPSEKAASPVSSRAHAAHEIKYASSLVLTSPSSGARAHTAILYAFCNRDRSSQRSAAIASLYVRHNPVHLVKLNICKFSLHSLLFLTL